MPIKIAPSILAADFTNLKSEVNAVEQAGADLLHLDIMDGQFVPNITFGPDQVSQLKNITKLPLEAHLMIKEPEHFVDKFAKAGADMISIHPESTYHPHRVLQSIRDLGVKSGIALNPGSPIHILQQFIDVLDFVLIMTVNPGFGGQTFISHQLQKIKEVSEMLAATDIVIEVDGGINPKNASKVAAAGAEMLVAGTAIFAEPQDNYSAVIAALKQGMQ